MKRVCGFLSSVFYLSLCVHSFIVLRVHSYTCKEKYLNVSIDHFSFIDNRTFALRYCVNDSFWKPNSGPIFFYTGSEGAIEVSIRNSGFIWESAVKFRALVVFAEHRFYGKSMPFGNLSYTDRKYYSYLTTQQALSDFVDVIYHLREEKKRGIRDIPNPVIAFGGSYGGMLAAWMRMKYPSVIEGSLASSAPIWTFSGMMSCDAFPKTLTSIYASTYKLCPKNIRLFWDELGSVAETGEGLSWLSKIWKLCHTLKTKDDVRKFRNLLEDMFSAVAMVNYPYPANFLKPLPANPVKEICMYISSPDLTGKVLVETMAKAASTFFNYTGDKTCLNWKNESAFGNDIGVQGWNIQSCLDMVIPWCTNGQTDMFIPSNPSNWTFHEWDKKCYSDYKLHPIENIAEKLYGGKNIDAASNIIFSNGDLDPCISGGVTTYKSSSTITSLVLAKAAHHLDLRASHVKDPHSVKQARKLYEKIFKKWIAKYYRRRKSI